MPTVDSVNETLHTDIKDKWYLQLRKKVLGYPLKFPKWRVESDTLLKYVKCRFPELGQDKDYWKYVVPKEEKSDILRSCHDNPLAGHGGIFKTFGRIASRYYWPKMRADITHYVRSCVVCTEHKPEQLKKPGLMGGKPKVANLGKW